MDSGKAVGGGLGIADRDMPGILLTPEPAGPVVLVLAQRADDRCSVASIHFGRIFRAASRPPDYRPWSIQRAARVKRWHWPDAKGSEPLVKTNRARATFNHYEVLLVIALVGTPFYAFGQGLQQQTNGTCSPTIAATQGSVTVTCNLTNVGLRDNALQNLEHCITELDRLMAAQAIYLLPAMADYKSNPREANWYVARDQVAATQRRLAAAIDSAIDYDVSLKDALGPDLREIHSELRQKAALLANVPQEPPPSAWVDTFGQNYRQTIERLRTQLVALHARLAASEVPKAD